VDFLTGLARRAAQASPLEVALTRAAFQHLLAGRRVGTADLSDETGGEAGPVAEALGRLTERGTLVVSDGEVIVARGLSRLATNHALEVSGRPLHALCAVDAIGIPAALGLEARIRSRCHGCRRPLAFGVADGRLADVPPGTVIWAADVDEDGPLHPHT
jgi:hypothetical protein